MRPRWSKTAKINNRIFKQSLYETAWGLGGGSLRALEKLRIHRCSSQERRFGSWLIIRQSATQDSLQLSSILPFAFCSLPLSLFAAIQDANSDGTFSQCIRVQFAKLIRQSWCG